MERVFAAGIERNRQCVKPVLRAGCACLGGADSGVVE